MLNSVSILELERLGCKVVLDWARGYVAYDQRNVVVASSGFLTREIGITWRTLGEYRPLFRVKARAAPP